MTTVAWDGKVLAADRQATNGGLKFHVTKLKKVNGSLLFSSGDLDTFVAMVEWFRHGANQKELPKVQGEKDTTISFFEVRPDGTLWCYERSAHPFLVEEPFYACGSGRDYALSAMKLGKGAVEAVLFAGEFDAYTGLGVTVLTLGEEKDEKTP